MHTGVNVCLVRSVLERCISRRRGSAALCCRVLPDAAASMLHGAHLHLCSRRCAHSPNRAVAVMLHLWRRGGCLTAVCPRFVKQAACSVGCARLRVRVWRGRGRLHPRGTEPEETARSPCLSQRGAGLLRRPIAPCDGAGWRWSGRGGARGDDGGQSRAECIVGRAGTRSEHSGDPEFRSANSLRLPIAQRSDPPHACRTTPTSASPCPPHTAPHPPGERRAPRLAAAWL